MQGRPERRAAGQRHQRVVGVVVGLLLEVGRVVQRLDRGQADEALGAADAQPDARSAGNATGSGE